VPYATTGTPALGDAVEPFLAACDAVLLANHGAVAWGATLAVARIRMESLVHAARILLESNVTEELLLAHEFATVAMGEGYLPARPLFAQTWDAFASSIGWPRRYEQGQECRADLPDVHDHPRYFDRVWLQRSGFRSFAAQAGRSLQVFAF